MRIDERATQLWPVLVFAAFHRQTTDCETLGRLIGAPREDIRALLMPVQRYCLEHGIPDLTVIVAGDDDAGSAARVAVFHHLWLDETTPTAADFARFTPQGQAPERRTLDG